MKRHVVLFLALLVLCVVPSRARVLKSFKLDNGRTDKNRIAAPVYAAGGVAPAVVEPLVSRLPAGHKVSRRLAGGWMPDFTLSPTVDLGRHLGVALQTEGAAMGLPIAAPGTAGWTISGTLDDVHMQTEPMGFGPILFWAYMQVTLTVRSAAGEPRPVTYRLHNMYGRSTWGGGGTQDKVSEALANFLIDSAQEILARLNRDFFHAPPQPGVEGKARALAALPHLDDREAELRAIGLSGAREAVPILLALLTKEKEEANRVYVIDALASLGAPEAASQLAQRYAFEDEDCRFFILKAWDYIGGEEARALIAQHGMTDRDPAARALAFRLRRKP